MPVNGTRYDMQGRDVEKVELNVYWSPDGKKVHLYLDGEKVDKRYLFDASEFREEVERRL